ncbi:hypothetical protein MBRA1_002076 [Malassezia brasiliensis]|uniref:Tethering factor for nuclear proteasome STS1 n=1 Tax=Malassezia brasiliensis TaxID=1821822 RepID=A0AAF0DSV5_9BASI|nr:hypothetical protein MBRA1_002076 [Malassezia brasiliensis]
MDIPASPTLTKRRRASSGRAGDETHGRSIRAPRKTQSAEVGKLLASLDKPALLSLLHELMQGNEELTERIYTLLPTPSLESVEHALDAAEAKVRAAIPLASANSAVPIRDQYIWSRVRTSLAELASEMTSYSSVFSLRHARNGTVHPATAFTFLHLATMRMIRILRLLPHTDFAPQSVSRKDHERLEMLFVHALPDAAKHSPNTVVHTILPALLRDWDDWLRAMDHGVNQEGRMYGQEVVTSWERGVASLGTTSTTLGASRSVEEQLLRATMDQALQQMHAALGWLTGPAHRPAWSLAHTHPMEEVGSLCH